MEGNIKIGIKIRNGAVVPETLQVFGRRELGEKRVAAVQES